MKHGWLRVFFLLTVAVTTATAQVQTEPLGDVARELRAERAGKPKLKVYTNEDVSTPKQPVSKVEQASAKSNKEAGDAEVATDEKSAKAESPKAEEEAKVKAKDKAEENDPEQRARAINQRYAEKIASIREKIAKAQDEISRIQRAQFASTAAYRQSLGTGPIETVYLQEQQAMSDQLDAQRKLIETLNTQLEDTKEEARHAGVRLED
jgi:Skp family chaperone for outer membrane proteins